jgi:hypothetical protein
VDQAVVSRVVRKPAVSRESAHKARSAYENGLVLANLDIDSRHDLSILIVQYPDVARRLRQGYHRVAFS